MDLAYSKNYIIILRKKGTYPDCMYEARIGHFRVNLGGFHSMRNFALLSGKFPMPEGTAFSRFSGIEYNFTRCTKIF